ncbi:MAG: VWA domain-containing protein [Terriglobus sp.]
MVLLGATICHAQDAPYTLRTGTELVILPTRVTSAGGDTIYGLRADQFVVEDNGLRQQVRVEPAEAGQGISLAVVVQCSRSAEDQMETLHDLSAMVNQIAGAGPHEVAVMIFGDGVKILSGFSKEDAVTEHALASMTPCRYDFGAVTLDAVAYANSLLQKQPQTSRHAILLVSETRDHGSKAHAEEVVAALGASNTLIYSVAYSPVRRAVTDYFRGSPEPAKQQPVKPVETDHPGSISSEAHDLTTAIIPKKPPVLSWPPYILAAANALRGNASAELAQLSGGEYFSFTDRASFDNDLQSIANHSHNLYQLSYRPSSDVAGTAGLHRITVRVPTYPNAHINSRTSYWLGEAK